MATPAGLKYFRRIKGLRSRTYHKRLIEMVTGSFGSPAP